MFWPENFRRYSIEKFAKLEAWHIAGRTTFSRDQLSPSPTQVLFFCFTPYDAFGMGADYESFDLWRQTAFFLDIEREKREQFGTRSDDLWCNPFLHDSTNPKTDAYRLLFGRKLHSLTRQRFFAIKRVSLFVDTVITSRDELPCNGLITYRYNDQLKLVV